MDISSEGDAWRLFLAQGREGMAASMPHTRQEGAEGALRGMTMVVWEGELRKIVEGSSFFVGKTTIIE